jgi:hypothetical protein
MPLLTRQAIQKAVKCPTWQVIRTKHLKGLPTREKIALLGVYLEATNYLSPDGKQCCTDETRWVQVYNYLNALARGGQIAPVFSRDLEEHRITILKEK